MALKKDEDKKEKAEKQAGGGEEGDFSELTVVIWRREVQMELL